MMASSILSRQSATPWGGTLVQFILNSIGSAVPQNQITCENENLSQITQNTLDLDSEISNHEERNNQVANSPREVVQRNSKRNSEESGKVLSKDFTSSLEPIRKIAVSPVINSTIDELHSQIGQQLDEIQQWFASSSEGGEDGESCEFQVPASFNPGYEHYGNTVDEDGCVGELRGKDDHERGPLGIMEHSCPTGTQGYYCEGDGKLIEDEGQFFCIYVVPCSD